MQVRNAVVFHWLHNFEENRYSWGRGINRRSLDCDAKGPRLEPRTFPSPFRQNLETCESCVRKCNQQEIDQPEKTMSLVDDSDCMQVTNNSTVSIHYISWNFELKASKTSCRFSLVKNELLASTWNSSVPIWLKNTDQFDDMAIELCMSTFQFIAEGYGNPLSEQSFLETEWKPVATNRNFELKQSLLKQKKMKQTWLKNYLDWKKKFEASAKFFLDLTGS